MTELLQQPLSTTTRLIEESLPGTALVGNKKYLGLAFLWPKDSSKNGHTFLPCVKRPRVGFIGQCPKKIAGLMKGERWLKKKRKKADCFLKGGFLHRFLSYNS